MSYRFKALFKLFSHFFLAIFTSLTISTSLTVLNSSTIFTSVTIITSLTILALVGNLDHQVAPLALIKKIHTTVSSAKKILSEEKWRPEDLGIPVRS